MDDIHTENSSINSILDPNHPAHKALKIGFLTPLLFSSPNNLIEVSHFPKDNLNEASLKVF